MKENQRDCKKQAGFLLLTSYFIVAVISIISLAVFTRSHIYLQSSERNRNKVAAFNMAEAGLDSAMASLKTDTAYGGSSGYTALGTNTGYAVSVCPPSCDADMAQPADPNVRFIRAHGYAPGNITTERGYENRSTLSYVELDDTPFEYGAFAETALTLNGTPLVDSYNSTVGDYGGANIGNEGDIASDGAITLIGTPTVLGETIEDPGISCSPVATGISSSGALTLNGSTNFQLPAGTYRFSSISITGNASLTLLGPVTIYLDGDANIEGNGIATSGNDPVNLLLIAAEATVISIGGGGSFYGAVFAPESAVAYSGTGDFYGAVIAKTYNQSGTSSLHFDVALKDVPGPCIDVNLKSWREENPVHSG